MKITSGIISWLFIPLIMPVLALLFAMYVPAELDYTSFNSLYYFDSRSKMYFLYFFVVFAFVAPGVSIVILKMAKVIKSIELESPSERFVPLFLTAAYSGMLMVFLIKLEKDVPISIHLIALTIAGLTLSVILGIINYWTKISLHTGGVGMFLGFVLAYSLEQNLLVFWPIYLVVLVAGLVTMARIYLGKHTPQQAYLGLVLGSFITFIVDYLSVHYWV